MLGQATLAAFEFVIYVWGSPDVEDLVSKTKPSRNASFG